MLNKDNQKIDFGYKTIRRSDKQKLVNNVFDSALEILLIELGV